MNVRTILLPLVLAAMFGLVACGGTTAGTGTTVPTVSSAQTANGGPTSSSGHSGTSLASISPCGLLTSADLSQFQLTRTDSGTALGARSCTWKNTTADNGFGYNIGFDLRDTQGIADIATDNVKITDDPVGSHPGKQSADASGGTCLVTIGVTSSSRVDVVGVASTDTAASCALANQFAKLIEPKLPPASN